MGFETNRLSLHRHNDKSQFTREAQQKNRKEMQRNTVPFRAENNTSSTVGSN